MLDWCSVCEKAIPPQTHTLLVPQPESQQPTEPAPPAPKDAPAAPQSAKAASASTSAKANAHAKSTKRPAHHRANTGHARVTARKALAKGAAKDKERTSGHEPKPEAAVVVDEPPQVPPAKASHPAPRQRTFISQEPSPLYCSEECRLIDEARHNLQLVSQHIAPMNPAWGQQIAPTPPHQYQSQSPHSNAYGFPSSPPSPIPFVADTNSRHPTEADWEAANNHYFQRAFHHAIEDPSNQPLQPDEDDTEVESRFRALLKATADTYIPLPQLQHSLSTTRLTQLAAAKMPPTHRTMSDTLVITSSANDPIPGGVGPLGNSSSDSVPSLSEDGHTSKTETDQSQKKQVSPADFPPPPTTPSSHQIRPTFLQMTALPSPPPTNRAPNKSKPSKSKPKTGLTPSASQTNISSMTSHSQQFLPGSAPATATGMSSHLTAPAQNAPQYLHYGGVSTLDLYAVGYPLAFEPSHSRVVRKPHHRVPSHEVPQPQETFMGEQITPTQSLLLPSTSGRQSVTMRRSRSGGSESSGSKSQHGDDDGLVMKKRNHSKARRPSATPHQDRGHDGFDSSSGLLVRASAPVPLPVAGSSGSQRAMSGRAGSFSGERDRTVIHLPEHLEPSRSRSRHSRPSSSHSSQHHPDDSVSRASSRSQSRSHQRYPSQSTSRHRPGSASHHPPMSSSPLSFSYLPSTTEEDPHSLQRTASRLSESYVPGQEDEPARKPAFRRMSSNGATTTSSAAARMAALGAPRSASGADTAGWGWSSLGGRIRSIAGIPSFDPIEDQKEPASSSKSQNEPSTHQPGSTPSSAVEGLAKYNDVTVRQKSPPKIMPPSIAEEPAEQPSSTPRRNGSFGVGLASLFGVWRFGMTTANNTEKGKEKLAPEAPAPPVDKPKEEPAEVAATPINTSISPSATRVDLPLSMSTADLPRAKRPLASLKLEDMPKPKMNIELVRSPVSPTSPNKAREHKHAPSPLSPPPTASRHPSDGPQLVMPTRSNWDPALIEEVKRARRLSRDTAQHHAPPQSGYTSPFEGRHETYEHSISPPPTPSSAGVSSRGFTQSRSNSHQNLPKAAQLPRTKSNHSVTSMATSAASHGHHTKPSNERKSSGGLPRGPSMTSITHATGGKGGHHGGMYHGQHHLHANDGTASVHKGSGLRKTSSQPYVNRWFSTSPTAGGSAFGSPSGRPVYHPPPSAEEHPNGGLPAPPPNLYATLPGVAGQYGVTKKKEKEFVPTYPVLALPSGTRKKLIWTTVKQPDGTDVDVQVEGEEEEEVYAERKRLFFFDG